MVEWKEKGSVNLMEKKTLFEIPIYSMSEKEFNKRWDKQKNLCMILISVMDILMKKHDLIYQILVFRVAHGNIIKL